MENKLFSNNNPSLYKPLDFNIACLCQKGSWGTLVKQQCFRAGFESVTLLYAGLEDEKLKQQFDLVFIDEKIDEERSGCEVADFLVTNGILKPTTAVIMVCEESTAIIHNYDTPLLLIDFISLPFSEKLLIEKVQRIAIILALFKPTLTFIGMGKLSFALKALSAIPKNLITKKVINEFILLNINLNYEMGNYTQVVNICNKPNVKKHAWSLWPSFKANYELGNWEYCKQSLQEETFTSLPSGPIKFFWQLRVLLQQQQFDEAFELINQYPSNEMPTTMVRLVFIILAFSQKSAEAINFIQRKIRLTKPNSDLFAKLTITLCNVYIFDYFLPIKNDKVQLLKELQTQVGALKESFVAKKYSLEITIIDFYLELIDKKSNDANKTNLHQVLQEVAGLNVSPIIDCRIAYAWFVIGEHEKAFATLVKIDCGFSYLPLGCERLTLGIVQTQIFNGIYPEEQRFDTYTKLGNEHYAQQRFKLACKAYARALHIRHDKKVRGLLAKAMSDAGMQQFSGFKVSVN